MSARPAHLLLSTERYGYLAQRIAATGSGFELGQVDASAFPDGERYHRIVTPVADRDVALVGGTISDEDTIELFDLACAAVHYGADRLTIVIPYFGHSTMERAVRPQEVVTAKNRARLLSAIPGAARGNRVVLLDLHSEGIPHYFEGAVSPVHLYAKRVVIALAQRLGGSDFVFACTDAGRAKWVESLANDCAVPAAFIFKRRLSGTETAVRAVSAHVEGKTVVIYDDMIRTGGSLIRAAEAYRDAGAASVAAICTHGLFCGDALERIAGSGLFAALACTDTHPRALALESDRLEVVSIAPLLAEFLLRGEGHA
jgi:ribose-phosphate pyrophosphokinase